MAGSDTFLCGVVEGFYGQQWAWQTRIDYAAYLQSLGLNSYLYCPKGDAYLRKRWQQPWPGEVLTQLRQTGTAYRQRNLLWGVGLSPFALYRDYGPEQRRQLHAKVAEIESLEAPLLAILFDDMPGDLDALAQRQADIVADVRYWLPSTRLLVCPTYYSADPVLEKYFGTMPEGYRAALGAALPEGVEIFWTGSKVCSDAIEMSEIREVSREFGRPVTLWDNYPVNDGALRSKHLYLDPLAQRDPDLRSLLAGHFCNPMNQGLLSLPAIAGLAQLYGCADDSEQLLQSVLGAETWAQLRHDASLFREQGLEAMDPIQRRELAARYDTLGGAAALEVAGWLRGEYTFDPACLTD